MNKKQLQKNIKDIEEQFNRFYQAGLFSARIKGKMFVACIEKENSQRRLQKQELIKKLSEFLKLHRCINSIEKGFKGGE